MPNKQRWGPGEAGRRKALLAKLHVATRQIGLDEETYRDFLEAETGQRSAGALSIGQIKRVLAIYRLWGWRDRRDPQIGVLRARARQIAERLPDGERRLDGLVRRICGVDRLAWCRDKEALSRLAAALGKIEREYPETPGKQEP